MANAALSPQPGAEPSAVVAAPGIVIPAFTESDILGNLRQSVAGPNAGLAYLGASAFRDALATVQTSATATTPAAGATVATITPGTAGLWEITGNVWITGTTVAATDTNNMRLNQTSTSRLPFIPVIVPGTTGVTALFPIPAVVLSLSAADTVNVTAIVLGTTGAVYGAQITARRVG